MMEHFAEVDEGQQVRCVHAVAFPYEGDPIEPLPGYTLVAVDGGIYGTHSDTSTLVLSNGQVIWQETASLETLRAKALAKCYVDVDLIYELAIGNREREYTTAEEEAREFVQTGTAGDYVTCFAQDNPTGQVQTNAWSATQILGRAQAFETAKLAMRAQRFKSQNAMRAASGYGQLATVQAAWDGFIAYLHSQLGL